MVTNEAGVPLERFSYDIFGKRRNVNGTDDAGSIANGSQIKGSMPRRGYTGHEMLDRFSLVHMNGRVYDPGLGRFLSADPIIQAPTMTQSYNRYSYVMNNPLYFTDPSGYSAWTRFRDKWLKPIAIAVVSYYTYGLVAEWAGGAALSAGFGGAGACTATGVIYTGAAGYAAAVAGGAAGGFTAGFIASEGDLKAGFQGAFAGGLLGGMNNVFSNQWSVGRVVTNSVASGTLNKMNGRSFNDGFRFALITSTIAMGFDAASKATDELKLKAVANGGNRADYNEWGELRTDGGRDVDYKQFNPNESKNWFTETGMEQEGSGKHWYDPNGPIENKYLARGINQVSKLHDWGNSWNYSSDTGFFMSRGAAFDTIFQSYSFATMPIAGVITGMGYAGQLPYEGLYRRPRN